MVLNGKLTANFPVYQSMNHCLVELHDGALMGDDLPTEKWNMIPAKRITKEIYAKCGKWK